MMVMIDRMMSEMMVDASCVYWTRMRHATILRVLEVERNGYWMTSLSHSGRSHHRRNLPGRKSKNQNPEQNHDPWPPVTTRSYITVPIPASSEQWSPLDYIVSRNRFLRPSESRKFWDDDTDGWHLRMTPHDSCPIAVLIFRSICTRSQGSISHTRILSWWRSSDVASPIALAKEESNMFWHDEWWCFRSESWRRNNLRWWFCGFSSTHCI